MKARPGGKSRPPGQASRPARSGRSRPDSQGVSGSAPGTPAGPGPGLQGPVLLWARLILAAVFLYAGWDKVLHPEDFASQVAAYRLIPRELVTLVAMALPWLELLAGGLLLVGFLSASNALVLGMLSLGFAGGAALALARGLNIECGCFSTSSSGMVDWGHVGLDLALLGLALLVLARGPGPWALDALVPGESA